MARSGTPSNASLTGPEARLNDRGGVAAVMRVLMVLEATFGEPRRSADQKEIMIQVWSEALGGFDTQTLYDAAKWCTQNMSQWPKPADMVARCREERKHFAESLGHKPTQQRWPQPPECPKAIAQRQRDTDMRRVQNRLMREAGCAPIDWSKPHASEFSRIEPFREAAHRELGYVD